jgi:hypothetical protein
MTYLSLKVLLKMSDNYVLLSVDPEREDVKEFPQCPGLLLFLAEIMMMPGSTKHNSVMYSIFFSPSVMSLCTFMYVATVSN